MLKNDNKKEEIKMKYHLIPEDELEKLLLEEGTHVCEETGTKTQYPLYVEGQNILKEIEQSYPAKELDKVFIPSFGDEEKHMPTEKQVILQEKNLKRYEKCLREVKQKLTSKSGYDFRIGWQYGFGTALKVIAFEKGELWK